jgi:hypothetical protein
VVLLVLCTNVQTYTDKEKKMKTIMLNCDTCKVEHDVFRMAHYQERSMCFGCNKKELEELYPNNDWSKFDNMAYSEFTSEEIAHWVECQ